MGLINRVTTFIKAGINDLLNRVEDPEKMLNQLMLELRDEKRKAQMSVVRCVADEKRLEQQVRDHQEKLAEWQKRAELAVMKDEDDLAREAIQRRNEYATMVDELTRQWEEQHQNSERLKDLLEDLEKKYKEAEFKKMHLLNQHRAAKANQQAAETISVLSNTGRHEEFAKVEQKIQEIGALAAANAELTMPALESKFARLESEGVVEHDLLHLKARLGKTVPSLATGNGNVTGALPPPSPPTSTEPPEESGGEAHPPPAASPGAGEFE